MAAFRFTDCLSAYTVQNQVWTAILGGAVPSNLIGTNDSTFYTHYTALSTVEANWDLQNLGRGDANTSLNNVLSFVADAVNWTNNNFTLDSPDVRESYFAATE